MQKILIAGATSAIASELARLWAARGARLYLLGGRNADKLRALERELGSAVVGAENADFDELDENAPRVERAVAALGGLDLAVIAHGDLGDQLASEASFVEAERIMRTNLLSVVALLIPIAQHLEEARRGAIVVLSSVAAERGRPRNFTYASAKAALNVYLEGMRSRLYPAGVHVHTIKLGPVDTPMTVDHAKNALFATAPRVAADIVAAVDAGRAAVYVPWFWSPIMAIVRHLPEPLFQRVRSLSGR